MKKLVFFIVLAMVTFMQAQTTTNQNGLQSTITNTLSADGTQAKRYEIAQVSYNSHHWQNSSVIIVELFNIRYRSGYEKYFIEIGHEQGAQGTSPKVSLVDSQGILHTANVTLGASVTHSSSRGNKPNKIIPIYVNVRDYSAYKVKITHLREEVSTFTSDGQIIINESPTGVNIDDFSVSEKVSTKMGDFTFNNGTYQEEDGPVSKIIDHTKFDNYILGAAWSSELGDNTRIGWGGAGAGEELIISQEKGLLWNGNVGIGTRSPEDKLFVKDGDINIRGINTSRYLRFTEGENLHQGAFINYDGTKNVLNLGVLEQASSDITQENNAISIVRSNGNVGIGSTSPEDKLFVKDGDINIRGINTSRYLRFTEGENLHQGAFINYDGTRNILNLGVLEQASSDITHENNAISIIRASGDVGIGTADTKGFKLGVKGKIAAEEVKVATHDNWADFVFKKEYKLPTLKEVEKHIKAKGHLRDIPSAEEVEKNGFYLGEMDAKLLQKIEELTLYTISQEKQLENQSKEIKTLKEENKVLKDLIKEVSKLKEEVKALKQ